MVYYETGERQVVVERLEPVLEMAGGDRRLGVGMKAWETTVITSFTEVLLLVGQDEVCCSATAG